MTLRRNDVIDAYGRPVLWEWLTFEEIAALRAAGKDMAILPVGSTEQHGPHLSVNVDSLSAESVARAVSGVTQVPVLPLLPYGAAWGHTTKWAGTLSLSPSTLTAVVTDVGEWLFAASGFSRLLILNGHTTNQAPLRCALEALRYRNPAMRVAIRGVWEISPRITNSYFDDAVDWHANAAETGLMMAIHPDAVRPDRIEDDPDRTRDLFFSYPVNRTSKNGATGYPSLGTSADGLELFRWAVEDLSDQVKRAMVEEPPF